jgi:hypothetical protein
MEVRESTPLEFNNFHERHARVLWIFGPVAQLTAQEAAQLNRKATPIAFFRSLDSQIAAGSPTLALVFGDDAEIKVTNMIDNLTRGVFAPTELICRPIG